MLPVMTLPGTGAVIFVTDSGMLMGEVMQSSRPPAGAHTEGRITSLLWALHHQRAVMVIPRHILAEVERDLPRRATPSDNVELAYHRLRTLYLPFARIVDVPPTWGDGDPRVLAVARRHIVDLPTARLAVALGYCFLLAEDPDLCDPPGLGFSAWLQVAHAAANGTEVETIYLAVRVPMVATEELVASASRRIAAASPAARWALVGVALVVVAGAIWLVRSGRAQPFIDRARPVLRELAETVGPPVMETLARHEQGQAVMARAAVPPAETRTLAERIARALAFHNDALLAEDIARELGSPGTLRDRTTLVRQELRSCSAFTEISRGRWILGSPSGYRPTNLPPAEVVDYWERLHKNTRKPRAAPSA